MSRKHFYLFGWMVSGFSFVAAFTMVADAAPLKSEWHFVPPPGSGVVNVKDYGAVGDGQADDTEAIAKAISDNIDKSRYRANPFIWFPKGTYKVTGPIESRVIAEGREAGKVWSAGWRSMLLLVGETRDGSIIKLADRANGYGDPNKPKWIIATGSEGDKRDNYGGGGNRAFRHGILNLTVDAGSGNPGAIGIDFIASNRGTIDGVTLRSGKDSGHTGIAMTRAWPGPAFVHDVRIEGFAKGMALNHYQYGMTFENIQMTGQREIGILNNQNVVAMRRVDFEGTVPFYKSESGHNLLCLLDSTLKGGGAEAAIYTAGMLNLRRVTFSGFDTAVDDTSKKNADVPADPGKPTFVASHDLGFTLNATGGKAAPLDLPIEDIPIIRAPSGAAWADAGETGETFQAAIDSGAEYIYVKPIKTLKLAKTVILRGKAKLILGLSGCVDGPDGLPAIRVEDGQSPVVVMEQMYIEGGVEQASGRTFVLNHGDLGRTGIKATGKGKTHVIDVIGRGYDIGSGHSFWARQLNAEFGADPLFTNSGTSWILGFKMESSPAGSKDAPESTPSLFNKGGRMEVLGGFLYTLGNKKEQAPRVPAFTNQRGDVAISYRVNGVPATYYSVILRMGSLQSGQDLMASQIKGPGAALLTDRR